MLLGDLERDEVAVDEEVDAGVLDAGDVGEDLELGVGLCFFFFLRCEKREERKEEEEEA